MRMRTWGVRDILHGFPRGPGTGSPGDPGLFEPGSVAERVNGETALLLGGGRALLMQLAHPMVAAGVTDHSDFLADPFGRLWNTLDLTLTVAFGDTHQSGAAATRIEEVHRGVVGRRGDESYAALDPDLLLWVHATLVDSAIETYERFVAPLRSDIRSRYYDQMRRQAAALRVPQEALPPGYLEFRVYVERTLRRLRVSDEARRLSAGVLDPTVSGPIRPLVQLLRFVTVGLLPRRLRDGYGLQWSATNERVLDAISAVVRSALPFVPDRIRRWPHARDADRRMTRVPGPPSV
jgi:uncharacterized protein (DUF2236 family)